MSNFYNLLKTLVNLAGTTAHIFQLLALFAFLFLSLLSLAFLWENVCNRNGLKKIAAPVIGID